MAQSARGDGGQDDFLGGIDIPVRDCPATGSDKWYKLEGKLNPGKVILDCHFLN